MIFHQKLLTHSATFPRAGFAHPSNIAKKTTIKSITISIVPNHPVENPPIWLFLFNIILIIAALI